MNDWNGGYVSDVGYTFGYYYYLNPLRAKLPFLNNGIALPEFSTACELGFGQGVSVNVHAAATGTQWYGTDFNPSQAAFAQELAEVSGSKAKLYDDAFAEFVNRKDLPEFDYIGLHGIWSWVSEENRSVLVDFIKKKLKVGGVLYLSYNVMPGWAAFSPMRHLMAEHAETMGSEGQGIVNRIDGSLSFAEQLLATQPKFATANPSVADRVKGLKGQDRHYLAHEYFNRDWSPVHFRKMAELLGSAKLNYACSAHYLDHVDALNLTAEQQGFLREIPDDTFRQSVRDFMVNQNFRRDYWVKGARKLSVLEKTEAMRKEKVLLVAPREDVVLKATGFLGEANLAPDIYNPILDFLSDHKPKTIAQVQQAVTGSGVSFAHIVQAMMVLVGGGYLENVQSETATDKARTHTDNLNRYLMDKARFSGDLGSLASPVSGGGFNLNRFQLLFLLALKEGKKQPQEWAQFVLSTLLSQNQKVAKEGKVLESADESLAYLTEQASVFQQKCLPILRSLKIV